MSANRGYGEILDVLGSQCAIIPIGDPAHENAARATVTTVGNGNGDGLVFTYSEAITAFDLQPFYQLTPFRMPVVRFNATDEEAVTPDVNFFSRDDSSNEAFSIGLWGNVTNSAAVRSFMTKWDAFQDIQEWQWTLRTDDTVRLTLRDDSFPQEVNSSTDAVATQGRLAFFVVTYDGGGGTTAANGITHYENGVVVASTATNSDNYSEMENGTAVLALGVVNTSGTPANFWNGAMLGGPLGPFFTQQELTAAEVRNLYHIGMQYQQASFPQSRRRGR